MATEPRAETSLQRTYQYLRIGIGASGILIAVGIAVDLISGGMSRPSISDYYYSDARNVFVGALIAVSLGLFALSGSGPQRVLLDAAAMLAPLIALVPGPRADWDRGAATTGVWTYLVFGVLLLVFVLLLRAAKSRQGIPFPDRAGFRWSIAIGAGWLVILATTVVVFPEAFRVAGHLASAGAFFVLTAVVALLHWRERTAELDPEADPTDPPPATATRAQRLIYAIVGFALLVDVAVLVVVAASSADRGWPLVALLEAVALVLFSVFWFVQSWQRRADVDPRIA